MNASTLSQSYPELAAGARKASSLIPLRDGTCGLEVLMLRRAEREGDQRSGVCVFPGGVLDSADVQSYDYCDGLDDVTASAKLGLSQDGLAYWVAAVRESFEEVGLLFARHADGRELDAHTLAAWQPWRDRLQRGETSTEEWAHSCGLRLQLAGLAYYSHWLTPLGHPKRFDTRFFLVRAPDGQVAQADMGEAVELMWLTPEAALSRERGLKLLPVTRQTLLQLKRHANVDAAFASLQSEGPQALVMPRAARNAKGPCILLPSDAAYAEVAKLDPQGHQQSFADIQPGRAVRLSDRVLRVTAPNPSVMTGPGTNSYLVAEPWAGPAADASEQSAPEWTVIDPGPADETHTQALIAAAAPGRIVRILVTHTHRDHSPGAAALHAATGAPVWGRIAQHPQGQDGTFSPELQPEHDHLLELGQSTTLRALHTPGHASNHLCWWLQEESMLFTGDHVMQGSTVVINPPDGDMAAYLAALRALLGLPLQWLAPGHGFLVAQPARVIEDLIAHRLRREAKVLAAVRSEPGDLASLVTRAYDDAPTALHALAQRSLLAHLLKLQAEGQVDAKTERADGQTAGPETAIWRAWGHAAAADAS